MEYNFLGRSGMKVSQIGLGTMTFGKGGRLCDEELSHKILNRYIELGGNFIDTADIYDKGNSEAFIGTWLERQTRENIVVATKVWAPMGADGNVNRAGLSRRHIVDAVQQSLDRLRTNYIDLYQMHIWDEGTPVEETVRTLDDLVRCGKVRYLGASNVCGWQMQKIVQTTKELGSSPFISLQQQYSLLSRQSELEAFQVCKSEGLGVITWSPLKGGFLTGKYAKGSVPTDGRLGWVAEDETGRGGEDFPAWSSLSDKSFQVLDAVKKIAKSKGKSAGQVSLRWLLQKDVVSSVIAGARSVEQLEDNMVAGSSDWSLSAEEMNELDEVSKPEQGYPYSFITSLNKAVGRSSDVYNNQHYVTSTSK